jgi:DNA-binding ferritin-like protein (Dps family)
MKKAVYPLYIYLCLIPTTALSTDVKKPSVLSKIKGFFSKNKDKEKPKGIAESNTVIGTVYHLCGDLQTLFKHSYDQIGMLKVKVATINAVKDTILEIHSKNDSLIKKQMMLIRKKNETGKLSEQGENELSKATKSLKEIGESLAQYNKQLGRLRADALSSFIDLLKEVRPLMVRMQEILNFAGYKEEQNPVKEWIKKCDQVVATGNQIVEQLLLMSKAYGEKSIHKPTKQDVQVDEYMKKVLELGQSYKTTFEKIKSIMQKISTAGKIANKLTLGYMKYLETVPTMLQNLVEVCSHVVSFAAEVGKVTQTNKLDEKQNALKNEIDASERTWKSYLAGIAQWIPLIS